MSGIERVDQLIVPRGGWANVYQRGSTGGPDLGQLLNKRGQWQALLPSGESVGPVRHTRRQALDDLFQYLAVTGEERNQ